MSSSSPSSALSTLGVKDAAKQLETFRQVDATRQEIFERLLQRVTELESALQTAKSDLEDQVAIRRQWKSRAEVAEAVLQQGLFALVLIDGDRYSFKDAYLQAGEVGGVEAASELSSQVKKYLLDSKIPGASVDLTIMAHVFANKGALAHALVDSGTLSDIRQLDEFLHGFTQSHPFFQFLDCGPSKTAVNAKIRGEYTKSPLPVQCS